MNLASILCIGMLASSRKRKQGRPTNEDGKFVCPWQLEVSGNDDRNIQGGALSAALAPNIMISSDRLCSGGFVHRIDESLRVQLESVLKYLMENDEDFLWFLEDEYYSSPEYSETEDEEEKMIALCKDTNETYDGKLQQ